MDTPIIAAINLNKICRICLEESEEMHSIFSALHNEDGEDEEDSIFIYDILMNISSIKVFLEDPLPTIVCTRCLGLANTTYKFQQQCNRSQVILEMYVTQFNKDKIHELNICTNADQEEDIANSDSICFFDISNENNFVEIATDVPVIEEVAEDISNNFDIDVNMKMGNQMGTCDETSDNDILKKEPTLKDLLDNCREECKRRLQEKNVNYCVKTTDDGDRVYACNFCNKEFKHGCSIKHHVTTHSLERPYICKICGKSFKVYNGLRHHIHIHSGEKPYKCQICGKKYKRSDSLTIHMRIHTGQRPFLCSVCGRGFRQAPDLGYHMRTHTKEKPYMCNICGKRMSMQSHLVQHIRTHTGERPFKCTQCDKAFPSSTRLKCHTIIHTGLKPYKCDVCEKSFNSKGILRAHAKIHSDERPHVCPVCGKGFIQRHSLRSHLGTHRLLSTNIALPTNSESTCHKQIKEKELNDKEV